MAKSGASDKLTAQIRVNGDIGEMISLIAEVEGITTAQLLDPMLRAQVLARFERHATVIAKLKAAKEEFERKRAEALAASHVTEAEEPTEKPKKKRSE